MAEPVLIEVCVDSIASAVAAERGGASRIALCSDLFEGGITPSAGLIAAVRARIRIPLHVIIRPRSGDFCYAQEELEVMHRDIETAKRIGANGVVFGVLDPAGHVDVGQTRALVELARPLSVTFHRAFDMSDDLFWALDDVCATGAGRILTSGGEPTCLQGSEKLAALVRRANGRIRIMAAGGIHHENATAIIERTGVREIHVGLSSVVESPMQYRNSRISMGKAPDREYQRSQVLEESVRQLHLAISSL